MLALSSSFENGQKPDGVRALKRIVFLDFDGVLVNRKSWYVRSGSMATADRVCVEALNSITETTRAGIVVSSSWRIGIAVSELRSILRGWGVCGIVVGATPKLNERKNGIYTSRPRGCEIQRWLDQEGKRFELESFVILDDESDMEHLSDKLVQTNFEIGLTAQHAERAIRMLQSANAGKQQPTLDSREEHQHMKEK